MRNRLWLAIGIVLGLISVALVHGYVSSREAQLRAAFLRARGEMTRVTVATVDIPEQTFVKPEMLTVDTKPADAVQPHAVIDPDQALGKVTLVPIYKGEQVLDSKLGERERANTLSMKTPQGKRAITIGVDTISSVGGFIRPGDFIDVVGIFAFPTPDGKQESVTVTLLQRVLVLATGGTFSEVGGGTEAKEANTITLALSPQEVELVLFARTQGSFQLALRPKADSTVLTDLPLMSAETLVATILGPKAALLKPPTPPPSDERRVEVYRGLEKEVVVLAK